MMARKKEEMWAATKAKLRVDPKADPWVVLWGKKTAHHLGN